MNKKWKHGLLKSHAVLICLAHKLEAYAQTLVGELTITDNSQIFDTPCTFDFLIDKFGLLNLVHQSGQQVQLAVTMDRVLLTWKVTQISQGVKMIDQRAEDPVDGAEVPLFGEEGNEKLQP